MLAVEAKPRQERTKAGEEIVDLVLLAADRVRISGLGIGRPDERKPEIFVDQADAAVVGLEIDHPALEAFDKLRMSKQDVRALGAADQLVIDAKTGIDLIDPG